MNMICKFLLAISLSIISINGYSQLSLPKIGTTQNKAISDLVRGISNESWFSSKDAKGKITYAKYFKSTPVGIKHALSEYEKLIEEYQAEDCSDETIYSSLCENADGSINYELLSLTLKSESSEIKKGCRLTDKIIKGISLRSSSTERTYYLILFVYTK